MYNGESYTHSDEVLCSLYHLSLMRRYFFKLVNDKYINIYQLALRYT